MSGFFICSKFIPLNKMKSKILIFISLIIINFEVLAQTTYSLTRPYGGGNISLVEIDIVLGTETIVYTYPPSELYDYNPEATAFDNQNNRFVTIGYFNNGNSDSLIAIDITNGNIDFTYQSSTDCLLYTSPSPRDRG